jgi:hypothetical protein
MDGRLTARLRAEYSSGSHPLHSTARVTVEKKREDHVARIEFFGPGGVLEKGRQSTTFRKYASHRESSAQ